MSLSGLKFVGKKVEKKDETAAKPAAQAGGGIKVRASMDWMSGPIDLLGRRPEVRGQTQDTCGTHQHMASS
jgi:hypothetical protein